MSDRLTLGDSDHRKLKHKMIGESSEPPPPSMDADDSEGLLTLKLMVGEPTEASNNEEITTSNNNQQRIFSCKFCDKKFHSSQALGGHQNAHRRESVLSKINKELDMGTFGRVGPHFCPYYSTIAGLPFAGSPFYPGLHHHMNPSLAHYGLQQGPANSALEAFRFGSRSSWAAEEGAVQRRGNRRSNVQNSSSPENTKPGESSGGATAGVGGSERNSYMGSIHNTSSGLDLSLSL